MAGIPFVRDLTFKYGEVARVSPRIRRVIAENPGPFTFLGTGVYIVGKGEVAVIDPGPVIDAHFEAIKAAVAGERITHVFTTHTHLDHSPLAHPLATWAGCKVYGRPDPNVAHVEVSLDEDGEAGFKPDVLVNDGDVFSGPDWTLEAITTPGHMSNHVCYALKEEAALFSGDHIMGWSTTVISPPDGNMRQYFASLDKIRARGFSTLWPTHGPPVTDVAPFIDAYATHRRAREAAILERIRAGDTLIPDMVKVIYKDVDKRLHAPAAHSVLAHVIQLVEEGRVIADGPLTLAAHYRPAG
ncbi:MAG TPA: MBL fold metallo-hydrolase [Hyphomonadaceae bacterium]|nr:MBL fold metallo-hydrolase [Hyphomonadaceae bacterium]HPI47099.1 MBL fold metallo-hydrolase [Hyphomonadaceae bacterium]